MLKDVVLNQAAKVFVKGDPNDRNIYVEYLGEVSGISYKEVLTIPVSKELLDTLNKKYQQN